jgi:uncharacterized protein (DUF169 family)
MTGYRALEQRLVSALGLERRPIAVAFRDAAPAGVEKFSGTEPSGCSFWRLAIAGRVFYTVAADHYNCPIGSHTHSIPLPPDRAQDLDHTLGLMTSVGYLRMEEVPGIPRLPREPAAIVYAPLGETPVDPDVVLFVGRPARVMLLQEAAVRAGVGVNVSLLGRPTCMALPAALAQGVVSSTGCIGNRVYTDVGDDALYVAVRGPDLGRVADEAEIIASANAALLAYHRERRQALSAESSAPGPSPA